ncbi:cytochrome b/b6 domain-containing protein [Litorisediminicola beolgyonensis]|uniref:Cytochrome b/b6 domain-containing protein n=1 Tax=Litorisediminicola beolgyonensis TaxID=1173614 RepID=A0ABW3ZLE2_9RHOB
MTEYRVWDPFIRLFHWALVAGFAANALVTDPESALHEWLGYAIAALLALRLVWGLVGPRFARFASFLPHPGAALGQLDDIAAGRARVHLGHTPLGALMILNLLGSVALIALTGWMMTTPTWFGIDWVEEAHEALVTWAEISVIVHVAAVIWESRRTGVNLPRAMITGVKRVPESASLAP